MLNTFVVALKLPKRNESVEVIKRENCIPGVWEPITGADNEDEAAELVDRINNMGGAGVYLDSVMENARREYKEKLVKN